MGVLVKTLHTTISATSNNEMLKGDAGIRHKCRDLYIAATMWFLCQPCGLTCKVWTAQVTNLVKERGGAVTLGIGDGANDVGMIQARLLPIPNPCPLPRSKHGT